MAAAGFNAPPRTRGKKTKDESDAVYGMPEPGRSVAIPGQCATPRCGAKADSLDESSAGLSGWTRAGVYGSREPDRVWCSGLCATFGIALAELRLTTNARRTAAAVRERGQADA
ncbi:hypothetical protein OG413_15785 [Streptomyces sp. NBC_01433]|uniref:hypothetical protein n=1 Tax=Streptomyces sp. NBC_01433 TaxID=2903864 RepID=UPI002252EB56|nr:hypothetical protein [Streptomyces sp. NBC_01433]MCX4676746.1 hypothetical protein [Streptomyces sp. NBC_01433]